MISPKQLNWSTNFFFLHLTLQTRDWTKLTFVGGGLVRFLKIFGCQLTKKYNFTLLFPLKFAYFSVEFDSGGSPSRAQKRVKLVCKIPCKLNPYFQKCCVYYWQKLNFWKNQVKNWTCILTHITLKCSCCIPTFHLVLKPQFHPPCFVVNSHDLFSVDFTRSISPWPWAWVAKLPISLLNFCNIASLLVFPSFKEATASLQQFSQSLGHFLRF